MAKTVAGSLIGRTGIRTMPFGKTALHLVLGNRPGPWWNLISKRETTAEKTLGVVVDTLMGGFYGAGTSFVISLSPPGNEAAKGAMAGALASIGTIAAGRVLRISDLMSADADEALEMIASGALFGAAQGLMLAQYGSGMMIQSHPLLVKQVNTRGFQRGRLEVSAPH